MTATHAKFFMIVEQVGKTTRYCIGGRLPGDRIVVLAKCANEFQAKRMLSMMLESDKTTG